MVVSVDATLSAPNEMLFLAVFKDAFVVSPRHAMALSLFTLSHEKI